MLNYDRQSVGQSVFVSGTHLGLVTNFSFSSTFSSDSWGFVILNRPLWREDGSVIYCCCWSLLAQTNCWVELSLSYCRRLVDQFVLVLGSPLGPMIRFYPYPFFSDNCSVVLTVRSPLWREDGSVTYSAIADWSGHWGPITIHYRLIWDCVFSSSPLTTRRDYGGGILTRIHFEVEVTLRPTVSGPVSLGVRPPSGTNDQFFFLLEYFFR
jgi:hypothetical protein